MSLSAMSVCGSESPVLPSHATKRSKIAGGQSSMSSSKASHCLGFLRVTSSRICWPREVSRKLARSQRSEEHTSELQSLAYLVCRLLLEKKKKKKRTDSKLHSIDEYIVI